MALAATGWSTVLDGRLGCFGWMALIYFQISARASDESKFKDVKHKFNVGDICLWSAGIVLYGFGCPPTQLGFCRACREYGITHGVKYRNDASQLARFKETILRDFIRS